MDFGTAIQTIATGAIGALIALGIKAWWEDRRRWHNDRRMVYARFIAATATAADLHGNVGQLVTRGVMRNLERADDMTRDQVWKGLLGERRGTLLEDAERDRRQAYMELRLIATKDVRNAAEDLAKATDRLDLVLVADDLADEVLTAAGEPLAADTFGSERQAWETSQNAFFRAARSELGV